MSNSIPFALEERGKYKFDVMADVVAQCEANSSTNNAECFSNVKCGPMFN